MYVSFSCTAVRSGKKSGDELNWIQKDYFSKLGNQKNGIQVEIDLCDAVPSSGCGQSRNIKKSATALVRVALGLTWKHNRKN